MNKRLRRIAAAMCITSLLATGASVYAEENAESYDIDYIGGNFTVTETEDGTLYAGSTCVARALRFMERFMPGFDIPDFELPVIRPGSKPETESRPENPDNKPETESRPENPGNGGPVNVSAYARQVAELTNDERSEAGLKDLRLSSELSEVAQRKAEDMRDNGYFSHTSPTYGTPFEMMTEFGISYKTAGENIAKGQRTPESVVDAWMNSKGHRDNILNTSYQKIGIGYCTDASGNTYWVQMFTD
ncbi:MAG: sporulation protein [Clostridiales bacterium]|nr:sporulation protein [Clostridiales bacterium]